MIRSHHPLVSAVAALLAAACGDADVDRNVSVNPDGDGDFSDAEAALVDDDVFATLTENGAVKLGLTPEMVYFELSDALREHVDSEIQTGVEDSDSRIARSIGSVVRRGLGRALEMRMSFDVAVIREVRYEGGELVFEFEDRGDARRLENMEVDDEALTRAFAEDDARAFVAAFAEVKATRRSGTP